MSVPLGPEVAEARDLHLQDRQHEHELAHIRANAQSDTTEKVPAQVGIPEDATKGSPAETLVDAEMSEEEKPKGLAFMLIISKSHQYLLTSQYALANAFGFHPPVPDLPVGLYLATFLFCLDVSIVAPGKALNSELYSLRFDSHSFASVLAIPVITNDFRDTSKATWFFSIYLALNTCFQPVAG